MKRSWIAIIAATVIVACNSEEEDFTQQRIDALFSEVEAGHYIDTLYSPLTKNEDGEEVSVIIGLRMRNADGQQDGPTLVIDTKGIIREEKYFRNGVNHGPMKRYFPNGVLDQEVNFRDGLLDSMGTKNYESGALQSKLMLFNNRPGGNSIEYYENGNPKLYAFVLPSGQQAYRIEYNEEGRKTAEEGKLMQMFLQVGEDSISVGEPFDLTAIVTDLPYLPVSEAQSFYVVYQQQGDEWVVVDRMNSDFSMGWDRIQIQFDEPGHYQLESVVDFRKNSDNGSRDSVLVTSNSVYVR